MQSVTLDLRNILQTDYATDSGVHTHINTAVRISNIKPQTNRDLNQVFDAMRRDGLASTVKVSFIPHSQWAEVITRIIPACGTRI